MRTSANLSMRPLAFVVNAIHKDRIGIVFYLSAKGENTTHKVNQLANDFDFESQIGFVHKFMLENTVNA